MSTNTWTKALTSGELLFILCNPYKEFPTACASNCIFDCSNFSANVAISVRTSNLSLLNFCNTYNDDPDDDVYLYKLQTRVLKNLYHMFPYRPARKA